MPHRKRYVYLISPASEYEMSSDKSTLIRMCGQKRHCDLGEIRTESWRAGAAGGKRTAGENICKEVHQSAA